jgi:ABC-type glycerol-3-phosphate transport system permease component
MAPSVARVARRSTTTLIWTIGMGLAVLWAFPFLWMVSTSFKPAAEGMLGGLSLIPSRPTLEHYTAVFDRYPMIRWAANSFLVAGTATVLGVLSSALAGYALARLRFPGRNFLFAMFLASLMVPIEVTVIPMLIGFIRVGWASTYQALILPSIAQVVGVYIFRQFFLGFPKDLEDAAVMDGASRWRIFWSIAFPIARAPTIAATVILFNLNWNNFLWPLLVTFDETMKTMPVGVAAFAPTIGSHTQLEGYGNGMAAVTLLSLPSLLLFFLLQRHFMAGMQSGGVKG